MHVVCRTTCTHTSGLIGGPRMQEWRHLDRLCRRVQAMKHSRSSNWIWVKAYILLCSFMARDIHSNGRAFAKLVVYMQTRMLGKADGPRECLRRAPMHVLLAKLLACPIRLDGVARSSYIHQPRLVCGNEKRRVFGVYRARKGRPFSGSLPNKPHERQGHLGDLYPINRDPCRISNVFGFIGSPDQQRRFHCAGLSWK